MENKTQTPTIEFIQIGDGNFVTREALPEAMAEGRVDEEFASQIAHMQRIEAAQDVLATVRDTLTSAVGKVASAAALEVRMAVFDKLHGTNYRTIRHELIEQKRREKFEASIGLIAIGRK